jgi:transposase InsO family protein
MLKQSVNIPPAKLSRERTFVKDPAEKLAQSRLRVLKLAEELGNIAAACRVGNMDRTSFYEWKRRFQTHGVSGLVDLPPVVKNHPMKTPDHVSEAVIELSKRNPAWGCKFLEGELSLQGIRISHPTVQRILVAAGRGTVTQRFLALEEEALAGLEITPEQVKVLEKLNPCFKERHVESSRPGELVCHDSFYVGHFKGIGRVYMHTAVDTFGSYAFASLATEKNAQRATELLWGHVVPFYEAHDLTLGSVLTDNGSEFCGTEEHPFEQMLFKLGIEHRRTKVKRPQTNGFVERFHKTVLNEFFRVQLRKKIYDQLEDLEIDLQEWLVNYNVARSHMGYRNLKRTPYQTVLMYLESVTQEA